MKNDFKSSFIKINDKQVPWIEKNNASSSEDPIHISAANGFTGASYIEFLNLFSDQFSITGMDCRGSWPDNNPPSRHFKMADFADDLILAIETQHSSPVIGLGHSQGGFVTLLAAIKRPELFSKIVLIEPASLPYRWFDYLYPFIPQAILFKFFPFMNGSLNRQNIWDSKEDFHQRYRHHNTYKRFTDESFNNYMDYGLTPKQDQWQLCFSPQWEAHIFTTVEFIWKHLPKVSVPTLFLRAEHSNLYTHEQFTKNNQRLPELIDTHEMNNTYHLLPFEQPKETSKTIKDWLFFHNI